MMPDVPDSEAADRETAHTVRSAALMLVAFAVVGSAIALFLMAMGGCAPLFSPADAKRAEDDTAAQIACANEAGTKAEAVDCQCAVRARYPEGPQCDGGAR
jgi:hypothetical protein